MNYLETRAYHYNLEPFLIAQDAPKKRGDSRLMIINNEKP
ncbi:MAG TPA: tRNA preQ1(34) S-adenosylmethionine ribosyltransferase-isomerase QueA, partial [Spirochaetia bacterium]|nr:tRNA preQ1(34) S-adenosylmethionine ribosyltransferase-isomerase QueA [Spirochaetia bacterium]